MSLGFDSLEDVREALCKSVPHFAVRDEISPARWVKFGSRAKTKDEAIGTAIENFYMTCAISRASETMAACLRATQADQAEAAE